MSTPTQFRVFLFNTSGHLVDWFKTFRHAPVGIEFTAADLLRHAPDTATNTTVHHIRRAAATLSGHRWFDPSGAKELRIVAPGLYIVELVPTTATRQRS